MTTILMSIHSKWAEKIYSGEKTIEVRKTIPQDALLPGDDWSPSGVTYPVSLMVMLYETAPVKKVTGYFYVQAIDSLRYCSPKRLTKRLEQAQLSYKEFVQYAGFRAGIYAYRIRYAKRYPEPMPLGFCDVARPPQSWRYVNRLPRRILLGHGLTAGEQQILADQIGL